jgi:hypothetical protein
MHLHDEKDGSKVCQPKINSVAFRQKSEFIRTLKSNHTGIFFFYLVYEGVRVGCVIPEGGCVVDSHRVFCHCRRILSPLQRVKVMRKEKHKFILISLKFLQPFKTDHLTQ